MDGPERLCSLPGGKLAWAFLGSWKEVVMLRRVNRELWSWEQHMDFGHCRVGKKVITRVRTSNEKLGV